MNYRREPVQEHDVKNPTPLFRFYPDPCPSCGEKVRTVITADPTDSELLREVFGCTSCSWLQEVGTRHPGKGYTWVTSEDEVDALRARVAELEECLRAIALERQSSLEALLIWYAHKQPKG